MIANHMFCLAKEAQLIKYFKEIFMLASIRIENIERFIIEYKKM
jgi:hypothetical protein